MIMSVRLSHFGSIRRVGIFQYVPHPLLEVSDHPGAKEVVVFVVWLGRLRKEPDEEKE
jgi:hypothetical protein